MCGYVLYLLWEAMLISYLSDRTTILPFTDIATLLSKSDYKIGLMVGSSQENSFRYSEDPYLGVPATSQILTGDSQNLSFSILRSVPFLIF